MKLIKYKENIIDLEEYNNIQFKKIMNYNNPYANKHSVIIFRNINDKYIYWYINDIEDFEIIKNKLVSLVDIDFNILINEMKDVVEDIEIDE